MDNLIRTFIAIELAPTLQEQLKSIQDHLKKNQVQVKWVNPKNIHVTLKFLGEISPEQIKIVKAVLQKTLSPFKTFSFEITHLGAFPKAENPHIIWVGINPGQHIIQDMAQFMENNLSSVGFEKEERDFEPHITLGRLKLSTNKFALAKAIKAFKFQQTLVQHVERVTLFKSTLTPQGPIYEILEHVDLQK